MDAKPQIYLVVGVPCSGKSWVCERLGALYDYVRHDDYMGVEEAYLIVIKLRMLIATKPLLIEAPFSISQIKDPLEKAGFNVVPVFILEAPATLATRYQTREGKPIPAGHLSRQKTYALRALEWNSFTGTSSEVLEHLKNAQRVERDLCVREKSDGRNLLFPWSNPPSEISGPNDAGRLDKVEVPVYAVGETIFNSYQPPSRGTVVSLDADEGTMGVKWDDGSSAITYPIDATYLRKPLPWES